MTTQFTPRLYVGTYAKYNAGSIKGAWLDLEDYSDRDSFYEACKELHKDESDPELMFQDFEGFPRALYCESSASEKLFEWVELDEHDRELLAVYLDEINGEGDIDEARDAFLGTATSKVDWAYGYLEDCGILKDVPECLQHYIDFEAYARDAEVNFVRRDGGELWVFSNN